MSQGIAPFDLLTKLTSVLNADELIARWVGLTEQQIADSVGSGRPKAYIIEETRKDHNGTPIHYCRATSVSPGLVGTKNNTKRYEYGDIAFSKDEVEDIERRTPDLRYQLEGPRGIPLTPAEASGTAFNQIPCYKLAKRWGCSDEDVLFIIKTGDFDFPCSDDDSESIDFVYDAIVFEDALIEWESSHKALLDYLKSHFLRHENHAREIQNLKDENIDKRNQTQAANNAHQENSINDWKRDFAIAIKLAFQLAQYTTPLDKSTFIKIWVCALQTNKIEGARQEARELFWQATREVMPTQKARHRSPHS